MTHYLDALFNPSSVAVIGVSAQNDRGGNEILRALRSEGYSGRTYGIGRGGGEFDGSRVFASVSELPEVPDLVFSAVSLKATPGALREAAIAGVKIGIVYTAGFAEMSAESATVERDMVEACNQHGMRIVGPNCMGVFNKTAGLNLTSLQGVSAGPVGLISQSGNIALTLFEAAERYDLGFSSFVSFGNQADIPLIDYIEYMAGDDATKVILLYIESLQHGVGEEFIRRCREVARQKPIVALKGGVTDGGRRAAASHTARLSAPRDIYAAAFAQAGILYVSELDNVLAVTEAVLRCPVLEHDRIAIVGSGGGHSTIAADYVELVGLSVPTFADDVVKDISQHLPPWAPVRNPVDMTGGFTEDLTLFARLMRYPLSQEDFAGGLSYGLYGENWRADLIDNNGLTFITAAPLLGQLQSELNKPIVFYTPYATTPSAAFTAMRRAGVPCYGSLAEAAAALAALRERGRFLANGMQRQGDSETTTVVGTSTAVTMTEHESLSLLASSGISTAYQRLVINASEAVSAADEMGYPVVLKAQLAGVAHKTDVGGVRLGINQATELIDAFDEMQQIGLRMGISTLPCTVAEQVPIERELIVGIRKDAVFGHTIIVGLGGLLTEIYAETIVMIPPITERHLEALLAGSPLSTYLGAWRGLAPVPLTKLHEVLCALHARCIEDPDIQSIDINPIVTVGNRLLALDASVTASRRRP